MRNSPVMNRWGTEIKAAMVSRQTGQEEKNEGIKVAHFNPMEVVHLFPILSAK